MNSKSTKITEPYAEALLDLTSGEKIENIINDINCISSIVSSSEELQKIINNPLVNSQKKKEIIKAIFSEKVKNKILKFLLVLCDKNRISYLTPILDKTIELAYKNNLIEIVHITSSIPITSAQQETLIGVLKRMTGAQEIKLTTSTDQNLIAGFVIQIKSKIIDTSIKGQLKQLSSHLGLVFP